MDGIDVIVELLGALAQENRVRIWMMLRGRSLSVNQITAVLGTPERPIDGSTVSRHLGVLRRVGLLEAQRQGQRILYSRASLRGNQPLQQLVRWVERQLEEEAQVIKDAAKLRKQRTR